jgi:hypothetical protein
LTWGKVGQFFLIHLLLHEQVEDKMLVDFCIFVEGRLGEGRPCSYELVSPPGDLLHADIIKVVGSLEWFNDSLLGHIVLPFDHFVDLLELVIDLLHDEPILIIQHFFILFNLHVYMLDLFKLLFQHPNILLVILSNIGDGIFTGDDTVVLVNGTPIDAVHAEKLILVFTVESNEVVVQ